MKSISWVGGLIKYTCSGDGVFDCLGRKTGTKYAPWLPVKACHLRRCGSLDLYFLVQRPSRPPSREKMFV